MNTVNYYPADNCGICKAFPDFPASPQMLSDCTLCLNSAAFDVFLSFPRSSRRSGNEYRHSQHRYGVRSQYGKWVIITSLFTIAGQMINALHVPVRGNTLHHHWGSPFRCFMGGFFSPWSHTSTCEFKGNNRFCLRVDWIHLSRGFDVLMSWKLCFGCHNLIIGFRALL